MNDAKRVTSEVFGNPVQQELQMDGFLPKSRARGTGARWKPPSLAGDNGLALRERIPGLPGPVLGRGKVVIPSETPADLLHPLSLAAHLRPSAQRQADAGGRLMLARMATLPRGNLRTEISNALVVAGVEPVFQKSTQVPPYRTFKSRDGSLAVIYLPRKRLPVAFHLGEQVSAWTGQRWRAIDRHEFEELTADLPIGTPLIRGTLGGSSLAPAFAQRLEVFLRNDRPIVLTPSKFGPSERSMITTAHRELMKVQLRNATRIPCLNSGIHLYRYRGTLVAALASEPAKPVGIISVGTTFVLPECRGSGIGCELVMAAYEDAARRYLHPSHFSVSGYKARVTAHAISCERAMEIGAGVDPQVLASNPMLHERFAPDIPPKFPSPSFIGGRPLHWRDGCWIEEGAHSTSPEPLPGYTMDAS